MSIGYVSLIMSKPGLKMKSCILKNASEERLIFLIKHNIEMLNKILDFNYAHNIFLFRISSGFIPFASHPINKINWCKMFKKEFLKLGEKAKKYGIRLSMHPGSIPPCPASITTVNNPLGVAAKTDGRNAKQDIEKIKTIKRMRTLFLMIKYFPEPPKILLQILLLGPFVFKLQFLNSAIEPTTLSFFLILSLEKLNVLNTFIKYLQK